MRKRRRTHLSHILDFAFLTIDSRKLELNKMLKKYSTGKQSAVMAFNTFDNSYCVL